MVVDGILCLPMRSAILFTLIAACSFASVNERSVKPEQLLAQGHFLEALSALESQREAAKAAHRDEDLATVMSNLGSVYYELGRHRDARHAFERSLVLRRELGQSETRDAARTAASRRDSAGLRITCGPTYQVACRSANLQ